MRMNDEQEMMEKRYSINGKFVKHIWPLKITFSSLSLSSKGLNIPLGSLSSVSFKARTCSRSINLYNDSLQIYIEFQYQKLVSSPGCIFFLFVIMPKYLVDEYQFINMMFSLLPAITQGSFPEMRHPKTLFF